MLNVILIILLLFLVQYIIRLWYVISISLVPERNPFYINLNQKKMAIAKKLIGFIFTAVAGLLGYQESPEMFASLATVIAVTFALTEIAKNYIQNVQVIQLISWALGIIISLAAWWVELGMFAELTWYFAATAGFLTALVTNGIADSEWIQSLWILIKSAFNKK